MRSVVRTFHTLGDFTLSYTTSARVGGFSDAATWTPLALASAIATNGAVLTITGNEVEASGGLDSNGNPPNTSVYTIQTPTMFVTGITGFRIATVLDADFFGNGPGRQPTNGNFVLTEFQVDALTQGPSTVPEPGTIGLLAAGLALLGYSRRRRRT